MTTIRNLSQEWWNTLDVETQMTHSYNYYDMRVYDSLTGREIENIFYQEVIVKWWGNLDSEYATSLIIKYFPNTTFDSFGMKEIYLKEHTKEEPTLDEEITELEEELWNSQTGPPESLGQPQSVDNSIDVEHLEQPKILKDFITAIKSEFKDENWDYLDFVADRVISQQPKEEVDVWYSEEDMRKCWAAAYDESYNKWIKNKPKTTFKKWLKQHYTLIKK